MVGKHNKPLVSIVILNWNGLEDTKLCLESVRNLKYPNYEIIVVDNGSNKDDKDYLSDLGDITYISNRKNKGFTGGHIDGYKSAKGDYILLLNNDAVIDSAYLDEALPVFDDPKVAVVGGRSYFWNNDEPLFDTSNKFYSYMTVDPITAETTLQTSDYGCIQEVNSVSGAAVVVRRNVIEEVGYLWAPFFAYYEETDLFARMKRAGYKIIYNNKLHIWHKNGASSDSQGGSSFFYNYIFRNRYLFAIRNFDDAYLKLFKKAYFNNFLGHLLRVLRSEADRRIVIAHAKAMRYVYTNRSRLYKSRKKLKSSSIDVSYNSKLITEQTGISLVIDSSDLDHDSVATLLSKLSNDTNPLHEYIVITGDIQSNDLAETKNVRTIVNKGYFDVAPINLGYLAAIFPWVAVGSPQTITDIDRYTESIANSYLDNSIEAIKLWNETALFNKSFLDLVGGFSYKSKHLTETINHAVKYAYVKSCLYTNETIDVSHKQRETIISQIATDRKITASQLTSRFDRFINKHYHLLQVYNVVRWFCVPSISLRRKAGRIKNFLLFTVTLNRKKIATELRYVREELYAERMKIKNSGSTKSLRQITNKFTKSQLKSIANIPVFIICFERVNDLSKLVTKLESIGLNKIIFIDNDSTFPPLLDYYKNSPYQVLRLKRNIGHTSPWSLSIIRTLIPYGYYIVTDPDVIPTNSCLANNPIEKMLSIHKKYKGYQKVGLGLKIDDLPQHYPLRQDVINWESQFWKTQLSNNIYEAGVDTTFALYKPNTYTYMLHPSIRTGEPLTARHMPWYTNPSNSTAEDVYYKARANANVTSWNVDELPERYKKELQKNKK